MKKIGILLLVLSVLTGAAYLFRLPLQHAAFEQILNQSTREFFAGTVRLKSVSMNQNTELSLQGLEGMLQTENGPVAVEMTAASTEKLWPNLFSEQGTVVHFSGIRPKGSRNPGVRGDARVKAGKNWHYQALFEIEGLDLREVRFLNPENLKGSTGMLRGSLQMMAHEARPEPQFQAVLLADQGGMLQARFFEVILPYLPALPTKAKMEELAEKEAMVRFQKAALRIETAAANRLKVALNILIPDYNVEANINLEVRIEEQTTFTELAQIVGILKVKP
jgi:hypothetical protein